MTTEPISATAEGMPKSNPPTLYRLIANYWDRYDLFVAAMRATDNAGRNTTEEAAAQAVQYEAADLLDKAAIPVLEYVPTWSIDAGIKSNFATGLAERNGGHMDPDHLTALLSSLPTLTDPKARTAQGAV